MSVKATVTLAWQHQETYIENNQQMTKPPTPGGQRSVQTPEGLVFVGSYIQRGKDGGDGGYANAVLWYEPLTAPDSTSDVKVVGFMETIKAHAVTIKYSDMFGEEFVTSYQVSEEEQMNPRSFRVSRPKAYGTDEPLVQNVTL